MPFPIIVHKIRRNSPFGVPHGKMMTFLRLQAPWEKITKCCLMCGPKWLEPITQSKCHCLSSRKIDNNWGYLPHCFVFVTHPWCLAYSTCLLNVCWISEWSRMLSIPAMGRWGLKGRGLIPFLNLKHAEPENLYKLWLWSCLGKAGGMTK